MFKSLFTTMACRKEILAFMFHTGLFSEAPMDVNEMKAFIGRRSIGLLLWHEMLSSVEGRLLLREWLDELDIEGSRND